MRHTDTMTGSPLISPHAVTQTKIKRPREETTSKGSYSTLTTVNPKTLEMTETIQHLDKTFHRHDKEGDSTTNVVGEPMHCIPNGIAFPLGRRKWKILGRHALFPPLFSLSFLQSFTVVHSHKLLLMMMMTLRHHH